MHKICRFGLLAISSIVSSSTVLAQNTAPGTEVLRAVLPPTLPGPATNTATCTSDDMRAAKSLTFSQRECLYRSRLLSKSFPIRAALFSAYGQLRRSGRDDRETQNFGPRFGAYYASRTAQNTGEFLAAYWNHEDPRYKPSLERGVWRRSRSALFSVLIARDTDGSTRMAFAPLAGAFGSGLAGAACYRNQSFMEEGLRRSATSYSFYFATALLREFKPELHRLVSRMTRGRFSR